MIRHKLASIFSCSTILRACPMLMVLFTGVSPFILEKRQRGAWPGPLPILLALRPCQPVVPPPFLQCPLPIPIVPKRENEEGRMSSPPSSNTALTQTSQPQALHP